jgi:O-antigen/teichoic acid export membrane protein
MSIARKILSNTAAQLIGKAFMALLGIAVVKICTNYLSVEEYGEYIMIYEFLAFFGIAADLGLFTIAVKEMAKDESQTEKIIGNVLSLRTILVVITMVAAVIAVYLIPSYENTRIPLGVAIASVTIFLTIVNGTLASVLQARLQMEYASIAMVLGKAASVVFMLYIVFFGFPNDKEMGFFMLLAAGIVGNLVMTFVTDYYVRKITKPKYRFDFDVWKNVFVQALPYGIALILNTVYFRVNSMFISIIRGQEEVGVYAVAMRMLEQLTVLPLYFMNSVLPVLTKSLQLKTDKYKTIIKYSFDFLAAMAVPMAVGGIVLATQIIRIVSSAKYLTRIEDGFYGSDIALKILVLAVLFQFLNILFGFVLVALGKQIKLLYINGACVLFNVLVNFIVVPMYGFRGAAITSVLSELFILVGTYIVAKRNLPFSISFKNLFKIILSAAVMGVVIYILEPFSAQYLKHWGVLLLIPIGMIVYTAMIFATKTVNKEMLALIKKTPPNESSHSQIQP